jgi:hypothetical protein
MTENKIFSVNFMYNRAIAHKNQMISAHTSASTNLKLVHVNRVRLCLWTVDSNGPTVQCPDDMWAQNHDGKMLTGEDWRTWRKTHSSATLSTTNPTLTCNLLSAHHTNPNKWHSKIMIYQIIIIIILKQKLNVHAGCVKNMKRLLTT